MGFLNLSVASKRASSFIATAFQRRRLPPFGTSWTGLSAFQNFACLKSQFAGFVCPVHVQPFFPSGVASGFGDNSQPSRHCTETAKIYAAQNPFPQRIEARGKNSSFDHLAAVETGWVLADFQPLWRARGASARQAKPVTSACSSPRQPPGFADLIFSFWASPLGKRWGLQRPSESPHRSPEGNFGRERREAIGNSE
jgi:hypothetical protein